MNPLSIKICGMKFHQNILNVSKIDPDYMGFIFYQDSPRFVGHEFELPYLAERIKKVGVFVNERVDFILSTAKKYKLNFVQLHGIETVENCFKIKSSGLGVIKAFSIGDDFNFDSVKQYHGAVDYMLFDRAGKYHGGNGLSFNWGQLRNYDQQTPFFLSGGISPGNIQLVESITNLNLHAIDINSGGEYSPGLKSISVIKKMKKIVLNHSVLQ